MISIERAGPEESARVRTILFAFIALIIISAVITPSDLVEAVFPSLFSYESSCLMLNIAGVPCPFCGMSRALAEFMKGNFAGSFFYNPSSVPFFILSGIMIGGVFVLSLLNFKIKISDVPKTFFAVAIVLFIIWILNILYGHHF